MFETDPFYRGYTDIPKVPKMANWELHKLRSWTADILSRPHLIQANMTDYYESLLETIDDELFARKFKKIRT